MRTLVLTPTSRPPGAVSRVVVHRLVANSPGLRCKVVALGDPAAAEFDRIGGIAVRRTPLGNLPRPLAIGALNGVALAEALRFRPDAVLSAHVTTAPAAAAIRRLAGLPVVQYFHAREIAARLRLAAFAAAHADASIAVSAYTRELVVAAGGRERAIHVVHPGVDLPPRRAGGDLGGPPTVVTIGRIESALQGPRRDGPGDGRRPSAPPRGALGGDRRRRPAAADRRPRPGGGPPTAAPPSSSARSTIASATNGCAARTSSRCRVG